MRQTSKLSTVPASDASLFDDLEFSVEVLPNVPHGLYEVVCEGCKKSLKFGRPVLLLPSDC
jgi:hypothetical protein